jgi:CubicO group peptidase (beta-lactamase class C family)
MSWKFGVMVLILAVLLAACDQEAGVSGTRPNVTATASPAEPTVEPTAEPTAEPTLAPTAVPTAEPTTVLPDESHEIPAVTLVPFSSETFAISGLVPEGWAEAAPGVYRRGSSATDLTSLIQQAAPGSSKDDLAGLLLGQLGLDALPQSIGSMDGEGLSWELYAIDVEAPGVGTVKVDLALAEAEVFDTSTDGSAYIVLLQSLPDEYEALHEAVFTPAVSAFTVAGEEDEEVGSVYRDPSGLFTVPVPTNWVLEEFEGYAVLTSPDEEITAYVLALEGDDLETAVADGWQMVDPDFAYELEEVIDEPAQDGVERAITITYDTGEDGPILIGGGWQHDGVSYVELFKSDLEGLQKRIYQMQIISTGYQITAIEEEDLTGIEPLPLSEEMIAELETYIVEKMEELDVVGASVAIVRDGELAYSNGFGLRDLETGEAVTPETMMMIGSTTKSITTMMMAQMVDAGIFEWDSRVVDILPSFSVADPEVTQQINMENMVCACSGVPRRDFEWLFNADELTAEEIIESLAEFEFFSDFGEAFQYSNQMVASGGYLAALAAGGEYGDLYTAYKEQLQESVLDPIGMPSSTLSFDAVVAGDNYASPYGKLPTGETIPLPLSTEEVLVPIGPAGALWSNVLDMSNYLITEMNEGVTPGGERIVSAENLAHTWEPQVAITADADYGLGWIVEDYDGLRILGHAGNTFGYSSELVFLPEANLGITILTNQRASAFNTIVRYKLLEMLYQQDSEIEELLQFQMGAVEEAQAELSDKLLDSISPEIIERYAGTYMNKALGEAEVFGTLLEVTGENEALILDVGEFQSVIRAYEKDNGETGYFTFTPPIEGVPLEFSEDADGNPQIIFGVGVVEYIFTKM